MSVPLQKTIRIGSLWFRNDLDAKWEQLIVSGHTVLIAGHTWPIRRLRYRVVRVFANNVSVTNHDEISVRDPTGVFKTQAAARILANIPQNNFSTVFSPVSDSFGHR